MRRTAGRFVRGLELPRKRGWNGGGGAEEVVFRKLRGLRNVGRGDSGEGIGRGGVGFFRFLTEEGEVLDDVFGCFGFRWVDLEERVGCFVNFGEVYVFVDLEERLCGMFLK